MADQQKLKIREFRDVTAKVQDTIENLQLDLDESDKRVKKLETGKRIMENKMLRLDTT